MRSDDVHSVVRNHQAMVRHHAKMAHYRMEQGLKSGKYNSRSDLQDFVSVGHKGLLKAVEKYNVRHVPKATFATLANWYIWSEMMRFQANSNGLMRVPVYRVDRERIKYEWQDDMHRWENFLVDAVPVESESKMLS